MTVRSLRPGAPHTNVEITAKKLPIFCPISPHLERRHSYVVNNHGFWNNKISVSSAVRITSRGIGNNYIYEYFVHLDFVQYSHK